MGDTEELGDLVDGSPALRLGNEYNGIVEDVIQDPGSVEIRYVLINVFNPELPARAYSAYATTTDSTEFFNLRRDNRVRVVITGAPNEERGENSYIATLIQVISKSAIKQ